MAVIRRLAIGALVATGLTAAAAARHEAAIDTISASTGQTLRQATLERAA